MITYCPEVPALAHPVEPLHSHAHCLELVLREIAQLRVELEAAR